MRVLVGERESFADMRVRGVDQNRHADGRVPEKQAGHVVGQINRRRPDALRCDEFRDVRYGGVADVEP